MWQKHCLSPVPTYVEPTGKSHGVLECFHITFTDQLLFGILGRRFEHRSDKPQILGSQQPVWQVRDLEEEHIPTTSGHIPTLLI